MMMFLQYAVWGAWLPMVAKYLSSPQIELEVKDWAAICKTLTEDGAKAEPSINKAFWEALANSKDANLDLFKKASTGAALDAQEQIKLSSDLQAILASAEIYKDRDMSWIQRTPKIGTLLDRLADSDKGAFTEIDRLSLNRLMFFHANPDKTVVREGGLGFTWAQIGLILGLAGSIGAVLSPFIAGQFADRYFSAERFLAVMILIGGCVKWLTAYQTTYTAWLWLSILYSVAFMPTLALTNSVAFAHMTNQQKQFPIVRVWGTLGWIAASWAFPLIWLLTKIEFQALPPFYKGEDLPNSTELLVNGLKFAGMLSFAYGLFCFFLPHTPPKKDAVEKLAFAKAFKLFKQPSFTILLLASIPVSVILQIYFIQTSAFFGAIGVPDSHIGPAMTIGQFAEIFAMALLGVMLAKAGFRWTIFVGIMAYVARFSIFGTTSLPVGVIVASQFFHGFCYACFFAGSFIYVDRIAPKDIRHSAQTLYGMFILGLGPVLGGYYCGWLGKHYAVAGAQLNYSGLWYNLAMIGLVTGIAFVVLFRTAPAAEEEGKAASA